MAPNNPPAPTRRRTTFKAAPAEAYAKLKRRVTKDWAAPVKQTPESPHAGLYEHTFSVYKVDWELIRGWLERKFREDEQFKQKLVQNPKLVSKYRTWFSWER